MAGWLSGAAMIPRRLISSLLSYDEQQRERSPSRDRDEGGGGDDDGDDGSEFESCLGTPMLVDDDLEDSEGCAWAGEVVMHRYEPERQAWVPIMHDVRLCVRRLSERPLRWVIDLDNREGDTVMRCPVGDQLSITFHHPTASLIFKAVAGEGDITEWAMRLVGDGAQRELDTFLRAYNTAVYESLSGMEVGEDAKGDPPDEDLEWMGPAQDLAEQERVEERQRMDEDGEDAVECDEFGGRDDFAAYRPGAGEYVGVFADNVQHGRLFAVRDDQTGASKIDVIAYGNEGIDEQNVTQISGLTHKRRQLQQPKDMIMQPTDNTKALMVEAGDAAGLHQIDLETQKVVTEYRPARGEDIELSKLMSAMKLDPDAPVVSALTHKGVFGMDLRKAASNCGVAERGETVREYEYKDRAMRKGGRKQLNCHATSEDGALAVGDAVGQIRLYSGTPGLPKRAGAGRHPKTAKTLLAGCGKPVLHLDITRRGEWVLATFDSFLWLLHVGTTGSTGFTERMGQKKPKPIRLELSFEQRRMVGWGSGFTKARFDAPHGAAEESTIVASAGNSLVTWNFDAIRRDPSGAASAPHVPAERGVREGPGRMLDAVSGGGLVRYVARDHVGVAAQRRAARPKARRAGVRYRDAWPGTGSPTDAPPVAAESPVRKGGGGGGDDGGSPGIRLLVRAGVCQ